ncbi:hypothetical protein ACFQY4_10405 [Catellatospora bangladeshensis]|uniref:Uncharacterized protein n=1 Tax=Catellatospora bangladeshensis TaxID=310355 RepID=A0A8J3JCB3_9ACTN|nr:hypothetical protein [Catellatospora bangladeshensis]GIF81681.1 hypothetical protein Cba03nite_30300 [Catellatospora bangladeshensis]
MPLHPQNDNEKTAEALLAALRHAVLDGPGSTPSRVRQAVAAAKIEELNQELRDYVETLREHAWRSTDDQVRELLAVGWVEDQVYELTVAVALGAGGRRVDAGLAALARAEARRAAGAPPTATVPTQSLPAAVQATPVAAQAEVRRAAA